MSSKDYLTEDSLLPKDQNFVCISFLSDPDNKLHFQELKLEEFLILLKKLQLMLKNYKV